MLRPAELVTLLINTAGALAKVDFSNAEARKSYMSIERQLTETLPMSMKKFMVANIAKTPFDDEEINIMGDTYKLKEIVSSLQYGGQVQEMQFGAQPQAFDAPPENVVRVPAGEVKDETAPVDNELKPLNVKEDSVPFELRGADEEEQGDFVVNSYAVEVEGKQDLEKMLTDAISAAAKDGVAVQPTGDPSQYTDKTNLVDVILGDGEIVIPKELIRYIGLDKLTKINNRGVAMMKAVETATKQGQAQAQEPVQ